MSTTPNDFSPSVAAALPPAAAVLAGLTHADIEQLRSEHSPVARARLAGKLGTQYSTTKLSERERALANDIFRLLAADAVAQVRSALSETLKNSRDLPHDIALKLARDVAEVALPMLECSVVLTEEDLVDIVRSTGTVAVLTAIARRESVSAELATALLQQGDVEVWHTLAANAGAVLTEESLEAKLDAIKGEDSLLNLLIRRGDMPLRLAEKLFAHASDEIKTLLTERYRLTLRVAEDNAEEVFELMTLGLIEAGTKAENVEDLVDQLYASGRLSFSLLVRMLCAGKLRFFEYAMAILSQVPALNARLLILDPGPHGFRSLYDKSGLPHGFYPAVKALLEVALEETQQGRYWRADYTQRMMERVMAKGYYGRVEHLDTLTAVVGKNTTSYAPVEDSSYA